MRILGISAFYHDSAAALIEDGQIVAAAQEERFTRKRHDSAFPEQAVRYCLQERKIGINDVDYVVFYEKPFVKFERLLETYLAFAPKGFSSFRKAIPVWLKDKLFQKMFLTEKLIELGASKDISEKLLFAEHHQAHAASAFFASPFNEAAVLTMDGVGEWTTTSVAFGKGNNLKFTKEIHFPHSIGLLYSAFTYYTGFKVNSGEYKVMGLAPYGQPVYKDLIFKHLVDLRSDGSYRLDMKYFDYCTGLVMTNAKFEKLFGGPPRRESEKLEQRHMDLAASIQDATEDIVLAIARNISNTVKVENLCLAGGVALNCVANGKILKEKLFKNIWIQPAAGDAGGALGAALAGYYEFLKSSRNTVGTDSMSGSYLGPSYSQEEVEKQLTALGAKFTRLSDDQLIDSTTHDIINGKAVGWFQGRMEFGPRALGSRSILADARSPTMQKDLNIKVKKRESFRPFAPSVLAENIQDWFDMNCESPYMGLVTTVKESQRKIPAVTHKDFSARVQTVHKNTNPRYHRLISKFKERTGCPVIVNTSFNVRGEPIVCTPEDAFRCFISTDIDSLAIENCYLRKQDQDAELIQKIRPTFEPD